MFFNKKRKVKSSKKSEETKSKQVKTSSKFSVDESEEEDEVNKLPERIILDEHEEDLVC